MTAGDREDYAAYIKDQMELRLTIGRAEYGDDFQEIDPIVSLEEELLDALAYLWWVRNLRSHLNARIWDDSTKIAWNAT